MGARRHPGRLQLAPARRGLASLRGAHGERRRARSGARRDGGRTAHQRAGGVHAGRRVHPRPVGRPRLLGRGRLLRARARGRRRDGEARRRVDRRGHTVPRRLAHGLAAVRRRLPQPRVHGGAHDGDLRDVLRRQVPGSRTDVQGGPSASRPRTPGSRSSAPSSARSPGGSVRTGSSRTRREASSRCVREGGRASSGRPRSAPSTSPAARAPHSSTRAPSPSSRSPATAPRTSSSRSAATGSPARSAPVTYTQMLNPRGGIECDFTVTRLGDARFLIVTGTAFGQHDLAWIRQHAPEDGSVSVTDVTSSFACFGLWGPKAREILDPLTTADLANEAFPYMQARHIAVGRVPVPRAAGDVRRRARLGALLRDRVRRRAVGCDLGGRPRARARRGRLQGDRLPSAREGLSRLGRRHHARGHALRGGARLRSEARQGRLRRARRTRGRARARSASPLPHARRSAGDRPRLGAGPRRRRTRWAA